MSEKFLYPEFTKTLPNFSPKELEKRRKRLFLNQVQAAVLCRCSVHTYRSWERGLRRMPEIGWAYFLVQYHRVRKALKKKYPHTWNANDPRID